MCDGFDLWTGWRRQVNKEEMNHVVAQDVLLQRWLGMKGAFLSKVVTAAPQHGGSPDKTPTKRLAGPLLMHGDTDTAQICWREDKSVGAATP